MWPMVYLSLIEHHDSVTVQHSVQPVCDGQRGAIQESTADRLLDQRVCLRVHSGSRLIQDQHLPKWCRGRYCLLARNCETPGIRS